MSTGKKKARRGRPPSGGTNPMIAIRWPARLLQGIDRYAQRETLPRSSALKQIVARYLVRERMLDPKVIYD